jgi:RNA polymerase sigma factor (sigma-70 family)
MQVDRSVYITEIYGQTFKGLQSVAIRTGCPRDEAADIVNSAFCKFINFMEKHAWDDSIVSSPFSYLATTVRHLAVDKHAHERAEKFTSLDDEESNYQVSDNGRSCAEVNAKMDEKEVYEKMLKPCMMGFTNQEKQLVWLLLIENMKPREIAAVLNKEYEFVSIDCNRIMAKLRARLKKTIINR